MIKSIVLAMARCPQCRSQVGFREILSAGIDCLQCHAALEVTTWSSLLTLLAALLVGALVRWSFESAGAGRWLRLLAWVLAFAGTYAVLLPWTARLRVRKGHPSIR